MKQVRQVRSYTAEFKSEAIQLAISSGNVAHTAKELGIPSPTLHNWVANVAGNEHNTPLLDKNKPAGPKVKVSDLMSEIKTLKKQLARSEQEKAILKKATAYFAQEQL